MVTQSRRILFCTYALRGHAGPLLSLAQAMAARGHEAHLAIPEEGRTWAGADIRLASWNPQSASIEAGSLTRYQQGARAEASRHRCWSRGHIAVVESLGATYEAIHASAVALLKEIDPDVLVTTQMAVPVMDAAQSLGIPFAICAVYLPADLRSNPITFTAGEPRAWWKGLADLYWGLRLGAAIKRYRGLREALLPAGCPTESELFHRNPVLSISAPCIEGEDGFPSNVHLLGPFERHPAPLGDSLGEWLGTRAEQGVIFVAFGSLVELTPHQVRALEEGLAACGRPVLWALPESQQGMLSPRSSSFRIESFVPQNAVLAHPAVRAFVNHAGANSFFEAMYWGRPMLAIPFMLDHPYYADRVVKLGVGRRLSAGSLSAEMVRSGVEHLFDASGPAEAARGISECLRQTPGLDGAAEILEGLLQDEHGAGNAKSGTPIGIPGASQEM